MEFGLHYAAHENGKTVNKTLKVDETLYRKAAEKGMNVRQYLRATCQDADYNYGDPLNQMLVNSGLVTDKKIGMPSMSMRDMMNAEVDAGQLRSPDGNNAALGARLLYPQLILDTMAEELTADGGEIISQLNSMVATTRNLNGKKADQPLINTKKAEGAEDEEIAELAEPPVMVTITTGEKSYRIPHQSIGLMVSDDALEATTIDLVRIVMTTQARAERIRRARRQLRAMIFGDKDRDMAPLTFKKMKQFDPTGISDNGQITKRAWIKWLRDNSELRDITHTMMTLDTALDLDDALLPTITGTDSAKIIAPYNSIQLGIRPPQIVEMKPDVLSNGVIVGLDSKSAIQRFVNVNASYEAIEEYVLRKAKAFRVDTGEMMVRLYDEAWSAVELTV